MNALDPDSAHEQGKGEEAQKGDGRGGHSRWMMIACCVPMLLLAVLIALSGAGLGFLFIAIGCTLMMAVMMGMMGAGPPDGRTGGSDENG